MKHKFTFYFFFLVREGAYFGEFLVDSPYETVLGVAGSAEQKKLFRSIKVGVSWT